MTVSEISELSEYFLSFNGHIEKDLPEGSKISVGFNKEKLRLEIIALIVYNGKEHTLGTYIKQNMLQDDPSYVQVLKDHFYPTVLRNFIRLVERSKN